ncbi:MAG: TIGR02679 family protein [Actinobacteria bacterium]|nr:TIGR02679 family protein [Actinomycetota bacterium]
MTGPVAGDRARLEQLLGGPELAWLRARVRARLETGRAVGGTATLRDPTPRQREGVDRLVGRRPTSGAALTVRLDEVDGILRRSGICDGLAAAVVTLDGPVEDRRARQEAEEAAWEDVFADAERWIPDEPWAAAWVQEVRTSGLVRRLAGDPAGGRRLLQHATEVIAALPATGVGRERLAAAVLSDSHGLDDDRPIATLVLRALRHRREPRRAAGPLPTGEERRALWASAGILLGELARPVLVVNLLAAGSGVTDVMLRACGESGEPARLTLRQLVRHPPDLSPLHARRVFVCENPAVIAAAADTLADASAPLVCVEGQPASAAQTLLTQLRDAGADLAYHGDFDWAGLRIAGLVMERFDARPWRFDAASYARAPAGPRLHGRAVPAPWDPALAPRMQRRGVAVHEEQVLDQLVDDVCR